MKYYEIRQKLKNNSYTLRFIVERKSIAESLCNRYPNLSYKEFDDGSEETKGE